MGYYEQVLRIKEILNQRWCKEAHFREVAGRVCCCVHGAAQIVCNPLVSRIFIAFDSTPGASENTAKVDECVSDLNQERYQGAFVAAGDAAIFTNIKPGTTVTENSCDNVGLLKAWAQRRVWVREDWIGADKGNLNLHYLLGMFGITSVFNDNEKTALAMMNAALDSCAAWTKDHEEFLANN